MLVLTRKLGESIMISDNITVTTLNVQKNKIKLGICAPRSVSVHRQEIYERIQQEEREEQTGRLIHYGRCISGNGMLVLTRTVGEAIIIGDDIKITILGMKGCQVRVGIEAPKNISVHREEIYERIRAEQCSSWADDEER